MSESLNDIIDAPEPRGWGVQPSEAAQAAQPGDSDAGTEHLETDDAGMELESTLESEVADELGLTPEEAETTAYKKLNGKLSAQGQENKDLREQLARLSGQVDTLTRTTVPQQETPSEETSDGMYTLQFDDAYVPELSEDASLYGSEAEIAQITRAIVQKEIRSALRQVTAQSEQLQQQHTAAEREQAAGGVIAEWAEKAKADPSFDKEAIGAIAKQTGNLYLEAPDMFLSLVESKLGISTAAKAKTPATPAPSVTRQPASVTPRHNRPGSGVRPLGRMAIGEGVDAAMKELGFG